MSNANPQQADYVMGKSELIEYVNADGKKLRAMLTKPENFDPVEEVSADGLHLRGADAGAAQLRRAERRHEHQHPALREQRLRRAAARHRLRDRLPGQSAEKCVIPAVNTVLAMGFIDPKRVGIQGHSWGGYQITYLVTKTNMFAAVAGRRVGVEHDQRLRRHPLGHRHVARVPVPRRRSRASARRHGTRRCSSSRTRRSSGSRRCRRRTSRSTTTRTMRSPGSRGSSGSTRCAVSARKATCSPSTVSGTACAAATT